MIDLRQMSTEEFNAHVSAVNAEVERRRTIANYEETIARLQAEYQAALGIVKGNGTQWQQPTGAHDTYKVGDIVEYSGNFYRSMIANNAWSPTDCPDVWERVPDDEIPEGTGEPEELDYPAWQAGTEYKPGDQVLYNGVAYEIIQAHTSATHWPPDQVASLYTRIS